jgi:hypothetical protein
LCGLTEWLDCWLRKRWHGSGKSHSSDQRGSHHKSNTNSQTVLLRCSFFVGTISNSIRSTDIKSPFRVLPHHHIITSLIPPRPQSSLHPFIVIISHLLYSPSTYWLMPITPQAGLSPAFPVVLLCSCPPLPKSSVPLCTTMVRPSTLCGPMSLTCLSVMVPLARPSASVLKLPRSPTWRSSSSGAPWVLLWGLTAITHTRQC